MALPVYTLNIHQGYQCRHSGVCCSAGWDIPIDRARLARVSEALASGDLEVPDPAEKGASPFIASPFVADEVLPDGAAGVLARTPTGDCAFLDRPAGRLCAIHRGLGHECLPSACRHFPRVILLDDDGVYVAFSHVCPTAADALFRDDPRELAVVTDAAVLADRGTVEGFDARGTVPPFVRPGTLFDRESRHAWDTFVLSACSQPHQAPEHVMARLARGAERLRAWSPGRGAMSAFARDVLSEVLAAPRGASALDPGAVLALYSTVAGTVPDSLARPAVPAGIRDVGWLWSDQPHLARVVNRYIASRAFGAWSAYRGEGVRTQVAMLAAALAVLDVEMSRRTGKDEGRPDTAILRDALGAADLLTLHQSDDQAVCRALGRVETLTPQAFMATIGVAGA